MAPEEDKDSLTRQREKCFAWGRGLLVLPFVLFLPYLFLVFGPAADYICSTASERSQQAGLSVFFLITYGPFALICFIFAAASFFAVPPKE